MGLEKDNSIASVSSLPQLFLELIDLVSNDSADTFSRKSQVLAEIRQTLVKRETVAALTKEADNNAPQGSVLHSFQQCLQPQSPHELRVIGLNQLFHMIGHSLPVESRLATIGALLRCQIPQIIVDKCLFDEKIAVAEAAAKFLVRFATDPSDQVK